MFNISITLGELPDEWKTARPPTLPPPFLPSLPLSLLHIPTGTFPHDTAADELCKQTRCRGMTHACSEYHRRRVSQHCTKGEWVACQTLNCTGILSFEWLRISLCSQRLKTAGWTVSRQGNNWWFWPTQWLVHSNHESIGNVHVT